MKRDNHYEAAFDAFLRERGIGFLAVDEAKRSLLGTSHVKSLDFIIVGPHDARLVIDVKGRRYPGGPSTKPIKAWQNWCTREDLDGLARWASVLGPGYKGVLAMTYHIVAPYTLAPEVPDQFCFRNQTYLMRGIMIDDYRIHMRTRSPRWDTVYLPAAIYRTLVKPFTHLARPNLVPQSTVSAVSP